MASVSEARRGASHRATGEGRGDSCQELVGRQGFADECNGPEQFAEVARLTPPSFEGDTLTYFGFKASVYRYRGEQAKARAYDDDSLRIRGLSRWKTAIRAAPQARG
ncbi:MAG: hypothetical protein ACREOC_07040 [Gemmatimonadales bacterium]